MERSALTFRIVPSSYGPDVYTFYLHLQTKTDDDQWPVKELIEVRTAEIRNYEGQDELEWAEHVIDEMYKIVNETRAVRMRRKLDSETVAQVGQASETVTDQM
jgi:hypothetical protein